MSQPNDLARRSVVGTLWNIGSSLWQLAIVLVRFTLLSRWLPKSTFGVYITANLVINLTVAMAGFGMGGAFLHRSKESENEADAAAQHFTLKLITTLVWASGVILFAMIATQDNTRLAIITLTVLRIFVELSQTPRLILVRRVVYRRIALLESLNALFTTIVALTLAANGYQLEALLATDLVTTVLTVVLFYFWRPMWRPQLRWVREEVRYFLTFGWKTLAGTQLLRLLDNLDEFWTRNVLGNIALADYGRAYDLATYPRRLLAVQLNKTVRGTYAELKDDRERLSKAFFRTNALLIRTGFYVGGLLVLVAPELVRILLTEKWLTMLDAFRLMLVFTLLDPIRITVGHLFIAVGAPEQLVRARLVQLVVLGIGLFAFGLPFGIAGVAVAVDLMLAIGIGLLLWWARAYISYSLPRLFGVPTVALVVAMGATIVAVRFAGLDSDWLRGGLKIAVFTVLYAAIWLPLERNQLVQMAQSLNRFRPNLRDSNRQNSNP